MDTILSFFIMAFAGLLSAPTLALSGIAGAFIGVLTLLFG